MVIHTLLQAPFLTILAILSLLLIGGLLVSDWIDKRRSRRMLAVVAELRKQHQQRIGQETAPHPHLTAGDGPVDAVRRGGNGRYGWFRWQGLLLAFLAGAAIMSLILRDKSSPRTPPTASRSRDAAEPGDPTARVAALHGGAFNLWYTNFSEEQRSPVQFDPAHISLWRDATEADPAVPITLSEPDRQVTDWKPVRGVDWRIVEVIHPRDTVIPQAPLTVVRTR